MTRTASRPYAERSAFVGGRDEPEQQLGAGFVQRCEAELEPGALRSPPVAVTPDVGGRCRAVDEPSTSPGWYATLTA